MQEHQSHQSWQLVWWKFRKHKMALVAGIVLAVMYFIAAFCEFLSPYLPGTRFPRIPVCTATALAPVVRR